MSTMTRLRGMTWDHPRGRGPAEAATALWRQSHPEVTVEWHTRPLSAFEDQPLSQLAADYDLLMIDHPHIGTVADGELVVPVEHWVDEEYLEDHRRNSTGPSVESYRHARSQWALAIDAAAQVGAYRTDLLAGLHQAIPTTWEEVVALGVATRGEAAQLLLPLNPTHAWCTVLAIAQAHTGPDLRTERRAGRVAGWHQALDTLTALVPLLDPRSAAVDPIAAAELATRTDTVLGLPLAFGYITYTRPIEQSQQRHLTYTNSPAGPGGLGSVLGGVGLALSARSTAPALAASLARLIGSGDFQRDGYLVAGGQPGHRSAWLDSELDRDAAGFFSATIATLDAAYTRSRAAAAPRVHRQCGDIVHRFLWRRSTTTAECAEELDRLTFELETHEESAWT